MIDKNKKLENICQNQKTYSIEILGKMYCTKGAYIGTKQCIYQKNYQEPMFHCLNPEFNQKKTYVLLNKL
ncbi:MAG: hypothetical protein ACOC3X_00585 [Nanoarchaeota archaeon]